MRAGGGGKGWRRNRRLFKACTGLTPGEYRRLFRPMSRAVGAAGADRSWRRSNAKPA